MVSNASLRDSATSSTRSTRRGAIAVPLLSEQRGAKLYQDITHPITLVKYNIGSPEGQDILRNLLQSLGYQ